ncbi:MAG: protein YgfX [Candidatus Thiodiazotropha sp.]
MSGKIQPITLRPKPSRYLHTWLIAIHLLALPAILFVPMLPWHKSLLLLLLLLQGYLTFLHTRKGSGRRILAARIRPDGRSRITMGDGRKLIARLRHDTLVTPWLVLLRFDPNVGWSHPALLLTQESLSEEEMRQLRVLLRFSQVNHNGANISH